MKTYKPHPELQKILSWDPITHTINHEKYGSFSITQFAQCPICDGQITEGFTTFLCLNTIAYHQRHITIPMLSYKTAYIADVNSPTGCVEEEYLAVISTYQHGYDINIDYYNEITSIYQEPSNENGYTASYVFQKIKLNYALPFNEITKETLQMLFLFS